ncbi:hypothetical protein, partial [Rhodoplanes sp. SY1]|uniref:hypothetical protein n=1 Tax=Rhodoplanes sp. SY1 TaxID=3166646 RepID=UPI0038B430F0
AFDFSSVVSRVDGAISAGGAAATGADAAFDGGSASAVDVATDTIYLADHGLVGGQEVVYTALNGSGFTADGVPTVTTAGTAIGGLVSGRTYYVIVVDEDHIQLSAAPVLDLDSAGTDPGSTHTVDVVDSIVVDLNAIGAADDTVRLSGHGFATGDTVTYTANGNAAISGLLDGGTYTVVKVDDSLFQLKDSTGTLVQLAQGAALGRHTFTRGAQSVDLVLARVEAASDTLVIKGHGLTEGMTVTYSTLGEEATDVVAGLTTATEYTVHVVDANTIQLRNATTGALIDLGTTTQAMAHALVFVSRSLSFAPSTAVDSAADTIALAGHGLSDGDTIIYATADTTTVRTITQPDGLVLTVTVADGEIGGLIDGGTYYVVVVDANHIRLVADPAAVATTKAVNLTSVGSGNYHTLGETKTTQGIAVTADLTATTKSIAKPEVGGKFNWSKYKLGADILTKPDVGLALFFKDASAATGKTTAVDQNGKEVTSSIKNDKLSAAGGVAVNVVGHTVRAEIGTDATAADRTVLSTKGDITVDATVTQKTQLLAQANVSKPKGSSGVAVALAIGVGVYENDVQAIVHGHDARRLRDRLGRRDAELSVPHQAGRSGARGLGRHPGPRRQRHRHAARRHARRLDQADEHLGGVWRQGEREQGGGPVRLVRHHRLHQHGEGAGAVRRADQPGADRCRLVAADHPERLGDGE